MSSYSFNPRNGAIKFKIKLYNCEGEWLNTSDFLLDTGAERTVVSSSVLTLLAVDAMSLKQIDEHYRRINTSKRRIFLGRPRFHVPSGLALQPDCALNTLHGLKVAPVFVIPKLGIMNHEITEIAAAYTDSEVFDDYHVQGILGLDVFSRFNARIYYDKQKIELTPRHNL